MNGTTHVRIYRTDAARLEALRRRLTVQAGGEPQNTADVIRLLLDEHEQRQPQEQAPAGEGEHEGERS